MPCGAPPKSAVMQIDVNCVTFQFQSVLVLTKSKTAALNMSITHVLPSCAHETQMCTSFSLQAVALMQPLRGNIRVVYLLFKRTHMLVFHTLLLCQYSRIVLDALSAAWSLLNFVCAQQSHSLLKIRQDCTYLAHHELESVILTIIIMVC